MLAFAVLRPLRLPEAVAAVPAALLVAGLGAVVQGHPALLDVIRWVGGAYLLVLGVRSLRSATRPGVLDPAAAVAGGGRRVTATAFAITWLNPHVYLDTVLLVGSIAAHHGPTGKWWFGAGAGLASVVWFTGLGYGARLAAPRLASPRAWQALDVLIGLVMLAIAVRLALGA